MNEAARMNVRWPVAAAAAVLLLAIGAAGAYLFMRTASAPPAGSAAPAKMTSTGAPREPTSTPTPGLADQPLPDVLVTLTAEAVRRAGIAVVPVTTGAAAGALRLPAIVEPNGYRQVIVTPLVAGRITRVLAELGQHVRLGQTMAQVFSPEVAEAQTRYISARAELEAHERELDRTEKLVEIGAASRQELERIHAEHTSRKTSVESVRARLELLGLPPATINGLGPGKVVEANTNVPAPIAGVVTERQANIGLNVDPAARLFTVVDLSNVWVVADVYEKDFSRVQVGSPAAITTTAYPDREFQGRVSYIDPQVSLQTRTARVRVEVPNPRNELRLGMFAEAHVRTSEQMHAILIPRSAVQNVGDRSVVYLVNPATPGQFTEREVRLGQQNADRVEALSGVAPGDSVVADGSFFLRAERDRLGLRQPQPGRRPGTVGL